MKFNLIIKLLLVFIITFFPSIVLAESKNEIINSSEIGKIFRNPGISPFNSGVNIISLRTGESIFNYNARKNLTPASNLKVLTSAAALTLLKPEFKFRTSVFSDGYIKSGIINGNIYLKGYGDPDLTAERLWRMVKKIKNTGLKEITGNLIADESFFDSEETGKGWKVQRYGNTIYSARISALSLNRNTVEVWLRAGESNGKKAIVSLEPDNDFFQIENNTYTGGAYPNVVISRSLTPEGKNKIIVKGSMPLGTHSEVNRINLDNPSLYTAYVFENLLKKEGIKVKGKIKKGITPTNAVEIGRTNSRTLSAIIYDFNKHSVNIIGEIILKYLGATYLGTPGSSEKGAEVIKKQFMEKLVKVDTTGFFMADGSGLSPLNKISPEQFVQVLRFMYNDFGLQGDFLSSMPISGADGTLRRRTKRLPGERKFRGKTGFINGVSCLTGYTMTVDKEPVAFSIMMNNFKNISSAMSIQDNICTYLATKYFNR